MIITICLNATDPLPYGSLLLQLLMSVAYKKIMNLLGWGMFGLCVSYLSSTETVITVVLCFAGTATNS
jgi:uncharacterized membrane protein YjjP (DUF1212 family)